MKTTASSFSMGRWNIRLLSGACLVWNAIEDEETDLVLGRQRHRSSSSHPVFSLSFSQVMNCVRGRVTEILSKL